MSAFRILNLRRFFEHRLRTVLSLLGVAIGSALIVAVLGLFGSLTGSVDRFVSDLAGSARLEVKAASDEGFDQNIYFKVASVEGVDAAVPMVRTTVQINGKRVLLLGIDQRAEKLGAKLSGKDLARLRAQANKPGLYLGEGLAAKLGVKEGSRLKIFSAGGEKNLEVLAVLRGEAGSFDQGLFAAAPLPLAQIITGKIGRLDSIFIIPKQGVALAALSQKLSAAAGDVASIDSPSQRAQQAQIATANLRNGMLFGVATALVVGAFLVFITMNMAATERRRELATLRALGAARGPLLRLFLLEAALIGALGSGFGVALGLSISRRLVATIPSYFVSAVGVELGYHVPPFAIPAAVAAGIAASVVAALIPALRAVSVAPVESMRPEGVLESAEGGEKVALFPALFGAAAIAGGLVLTTAGPARYGFVGVAVGFAGIVVGSYGLTAPITKAGAALASLFGVSGRLAGEALVRAPRRAWATSTAVLLAAGMVVGQAGIFNNVNRSMHENLDTLKKIDLYVTSPTSSVDFGADVLLPGDWPAGLAAIKGVGAVGTNSFSFITFNHQRVLLQGLSGPTAQYSPAFARSTEQIRRQILDGKGAVISTRFAELYGKRAGDFLTLSTPTGMRRIEVLSTANSMTWERGLITVGRPVMEQWFGLTGVSDYDIQLARGADPAAAKKAVEQFTANSPTKVKVITGNEELEAIMVVAGQVNSLFSSMMIVVVGAATLAILNALLISVVQRRRELGIMRALGAQRRHLRRMVGIEAAAIGALGGLIGGAFGFLVHRAALATVAEQSGFPIQYHFVLRPALSAVAVGIIVSIAGSLLPAQRAGATNIIEAIGYE
jgi:putative ABC transport system permease protein